MPEGENLLETRYALGDGACELSFAKVEPALRAREQLTLFWRVAACADLSSRLRLVADMPQMSHGPTEVELQRDGDLYQGSILFVMGGRWELALFDGERELLRGWLDVAER